MPQKTRLNYSLSDQVAKDLDAYCQTTGRKTAEVARQVILDYLDMEPDEALPACVGHPTGKRSDLWLQPASMAALDRRIKREGHASRSAVICALLMNFLNSRPAPSTVAVTVNVPIALWNRLGEDKEAAIISAIEDSIEDKELIRA